MKALVTGGAGFIGSWVVDALIQEGWDVVVVDNLSTGDVKNLNKKAVFYERDIQDTALDAIFQKEKPHYVFHLAAQINLRKSIQEPREDAQINIIGSLNLLNNCVKHAVKKIIFSSTGGAIYGDNVTIPTSENEVQNPPSPYGIAKLTIEKYLAFFKAVHNVDYTVLRYSNVYGPRQNSKGEAGVIAIFLNNLLTDQQCIIHGSGEQKRDYVYVKDVAKANLLAANLHGIYNVGTGKETSVNELFHTLASLLKKNALPIHTPAIQGELLRSCLDASKLKREGWHPTYSLEQGLTETVQYFLAGNK